MDDSRALRRLRCGDPAALEALVERYTPYVAAVIRNQLGQLARREDVEELCSDVFLRLWQHCGTLRQDRLRGWLSAVARNQARDLLRGLKLPEREEDAILVADTDLEEEALRKEQNRLIREAVLAMAQPDREIFLRHYFYNQKCREIAAEMELKEETVKTRLKRGREKLRATIQKGGFICEMEDC